MNADLAIKRRGAEKKTASSGGDFGSVKELEELKKRGNRGSLSFPRACQWVLRMEVLLGFSFPNVSIKCLGDSDCRRAFATPSDGIIRS